MKILKRPRTFMIILPAVLVFVLISIQFVRPKLENPVVTGDFKAPADVKAIMKRACYDCHSNETNLRWYDKVAPVYWQVAEHVKEGRSSLNFSTWDSLAPGDQKAKLWEAVNQILAGAMPVKNYELVHPSAKLTNSDISILKKYIGSMSARNVPGDTSKTNALTKQIGHLKETKTEIILPKSLNGISYMPDYKNWDAISTTDRYDNGTMRVIFGNVIAVKAIRENHINPWPNGAILAKVAWDEIVDQDENVSTGAFRQVEYMIKDDKKYASTKGWGFARFKTPAMIPYGKTETFATECVNCHKPMSSNDYVFTKPIKF